jgi:hypothetical protein
MKFVLHLKHWQLFLLMFGLPMVVYLIFIFSVFATFAAQPTEDPTMTLMSSGAFVFLLMLIGAVVSISWMYNMATGLYKILPEGVHMKIKRFYFAFFFPMAYFACIMISLAAFIPHVVNQPNNSPPPGGIFAFMGVFMIVHFFAIACIFYVFYFIAKSLKSVELNRTAQAGEYVADFVLLWFSFVGVWLIQPRINEIFSGKNSVQDAGTSRYLR